MMYYGWLNRTEGLMTANGYDVLLMVNRDDVLWMVNQNGCIDEG
jgi:hypothetical protein